LTCAAEFREVDGYATDGVGPACVFEAVVGTAAAGGVAGCAAAGSGGAEGRAGAAKSRGAR